MTITPLQYYQQKIDSDVVCPDKNQYAIIQQLDTLYYALTKNKKKMPIKGIYLWGNVGVGKTFLIDCFYHTLPIKKLRIHFHAFMKRIHELLKLSQGKKNPLKYIAKQIAHDAWVICFDEFFVSDIADAMILSELFHALFDQGVTLVATSNIAPDQLYQEGLQRERFLSAIQLIKQQTDVIHLDTVTDYRQRHIQEISAYYSPLNHVTQKKMEDCFVRFSHAMPITTNPIIICHRPISIIKQADSVVWFEFDIICGRPRSQHDYLDIAKQYHTILISGLRPLKPNEKDLILSFMYLVDILYDTHRRLIIAASHPLEEIYIQKNSLINFQRTLSRLIEMQSTSYSYHNK